MRASVQAVLLIFLSLAAWPASVVSAQFVSPASRVLVVSEGKSTKFSIDAAGCKPTWVASSDTQGVSVTPDTGNASQKRNFVVNAAAGTAGTEAEVTVTMTDDGCLKGPLDCVLTVYVVMDAKHAEKAFKSGDKNTGVVGVSARMKTLKKELKAAEKNYQNGLNAVLVDLKDGGLATADGMVHEHELVLWQMFLLMAIAYRAMFGSYFNFMNGCCSDGISILSLYYFLGPFLLFTAPATFMSGGCGVWDGALIGAFALMLASLGNLNKMNKKFSGKAGKFLPTAGIFMAFSVFSLFSMVGVFPGPLTQGVEDANSLDDSIQIVHVCSVNGAVTGSPTDNGRIAVLGRGAASSTVTVTYQRLSAQGVPVGDPIEDTPAVGADNVWTSTAPGVEVPANLSPGTWDVKVTDGSTTATRRIQVGIVTG